ncbi:MAG TPA: hypothetical protein PLL17_06125 [Defluviitaleaceae bacterium]|nr:hypothetical protein [Candidatus Epulonipiscium sp.]HOQ17429.1 hypothetical protein [Defluviitaleaceae bacterium]HQD50691.1 hypothetical protein [Defluviitaleaceae bacterium]
MICEDKTFIDVFDWVPDADYDSRIGEWYVKVKENSGQIYVCAPYVDTMTKQLVLTLSKEITLKERWKKSRFRSRHAT